jgi:hypothetical protein
MRRCTAGVEGDPMNARRRVLAGAVALALSPRTVSAQVAAPGAARPLQVGILRPTAPPGDTTPSDFSTGMPNALRALAARDGRRVIVEARYGDMRPERLPALARELARADRIIH